MKPKRRMVEFIDDVGAEPKFIDVEEETSHAEDGKKDEADQADGEGQKDPRS